MTTIQRAGFLIVLLGLLGVQPAAAQLHEAGRAGSLNLKGYVQPELGVSTLNGDASLLAGGLLVALVEPELAFGVGGWTTVTRPAADGVWEGGTEYASSYGMTLGGVFAGYSFNPGRPVHWGLELMLGVGAVERTLDDDGPFDYSPDPDNLYFALPSVRAVWRINDWLRATGAVGYRAVGAVDRLGLDSGAASGPVLTLGLQAGVF